MFRAELHTLAALLAALFCFAPHAGAAPLPFAETAHLGRPPRPVRIEASGGSELVLTIAGKKRPVPVRNASALTIETISVAPNGAIALLRASGENGAWVGLVGGRSGSELLLFERAELSGDPGERRVREIALRGDPKELHTGIRYERVSLCGERSVLFATQRLDPSTLNLVDEAIAPAVSGVVDTAVASSTSPLTPPKLLLLDAVSSSELDPTMGLPRTPRALVDGDAQRGITLRPGGFAILRWNGGTLPIERLELELGKANARPLELLWLGDGDSALRATLPSGVSSEKQRRVTITPPTPFQSRCLALFIPESTEGGSLEVREVRGYSELDREGGLDRLVGALVQDQAESAGAAELLAKVGPEAAERVAARWDELSARGKRRALKVLVSALDRAPVRERVRQAAQSDDRPLAESAVAMLQRSGEPGRALLRELVLVDGDVGDRAALALAPLLEETGHLLAALEREGGEDRPALRKSLALAARRDRARFEALAREWLAGSPRVGARAALALASASAGLRELSSQAAEQPAQAERFEDRFRLALALAQSGPSSEADRWLAAQAEGASEWMQRVSALDALMRRGAGELPRVAEALARDPYPRVRASALPALLGAGNRPLVERAAASDEWPLVRVAAVRDLARDPAGKAALESALADRSRHVRRAAIEALDTQAQSASWPRVQARLTANGEALEVREAAIAFARNLCVAEAGPSLVALARRLSSADASEDDTRLAVEALRALHDLGGAAAQEGQRLVDEAAMPELTKLWGRLPAARCTGTPRS